MRKLRGVKREVQSESEEKSNKTKTKVLQIPVDEDLHVWVQAQAKNEGVKAAAITRRAIIRDRERFELDPKKQIRIGVEASSERLTQCLRTRVDEELHAWMCDRAEKEGLTVAAIGRRAVLRDRERIRQESLERLEVKMSSAKRRRT